MDYSKIIIPSSLHPDTILAIFLLKKFGGKKYPGIGGAEIEIRQVLAENDTPVSLKEKGVICLDVGQGEFDHHADKEGKILSELVARDLEIATDPALAKLLAYAARDDKFGMGTISTDQLDRAFGLSGLISSINKTVQVPEKILQILFPVLEAHYLEERKRTTELPLEFEKNAKEGKAEVTEVKHKDKKLKVVFLESDNVSMPGWIKSSAGLKADVVCMRTSPGYTNILTKQQKMIDLRWLAAHVRHEESELKGENITYSAEILMSEGNISEIPEWYYDRATNSLLNGGTNPKGIQPTRIPLARIKTIVVDALSKDIPRYGN